MMKTCSNCGKTWDDEQSFCSACGKPLDTAAEGSATPGESPVKSEPLIPSAEAQTEPAVESSETQDTPFVSPVTEPVPFAAKKKRFPIWLPILIVVLLIAVGAAAFFILRGKPASTENVKHPKNYSLYIKENDLYYYGADAEKPIQCGQGVFKDPDDHGFVYSFNTNTFSDDGKKFFYAQNIDTEDDTYTLFFRDLQKPEEAPVKIAEDVKAYLVLHKNAGVLYVNADGSIYKHDFSERTKLVSETEDYRFSDDQQRIAYLTEDDSLYIQPIGADKIKIDSDVDEISYASGDLQTIYYLKDGSLFRKVGEEERQKIDTDVEQVVKVYKSGEVYYTKSNGDDTEEVEKTLYDYVTEPKDQADKDEEILDKEKGRTKNSQILIRDAKFRIWTRDALKEKKIEVEPILSLYFYNGTEASLVTKTYSKCYDYAADVPILAVKCYDNVKLNKLSLTEIIDALDKEEHFIQRWNDGKTIYQSDFKKFDYYDTYRDVILGAISDCAVDYIVTGETADALDGTAPDYYINDAGTQIMFVSDVDEQVGTLRCIRFEQEAMLPAEEYDTEVYADTAFGFNKAGHFLYRKNYNEEKSIYDLYMDKALVDYDVHSCTSQNDGTLILFTTDYDSDSGSYMLNRFAGGEKAKVAESVCDYDIWDDGTLLYLCNPSSNKKYDLYISKDGTNTNVDFDVLNFVDNVMSTTYGIFTLRWNVGDD